MSGPAMDEDVARGARPLLQLGAASVGGLMLPEAKPSPGTMYAPRGVCHLPGGGLAVVDTGNHRVLLWNDMPTRAHQDADVVLGQPDMQSEGPNNGGPERGLHLPCGVAVLDGALYVCDAWNHRVLVWDEVPTRSGTAPDGVIGQGDLTGHTNNRGGAIGPSGLDCPYGLGVFGGNLVITDTQNRRVLVYDGVPRRDAPAVLAMGQADSTSGAENRGTGPGPRSFRWPHAVCTFAGVRWVADAGNHRLLGWSATADLTGPADHVIGHGDFTSSHEMPHVPQGPAKLRFPYAVAADAGRMLVADTANNRILGWRGEPAPLGAAASFVLGQHDFDKAGENRWDMILPDTLCWPYGMDLAGTSLAVADSGNNRVTLWEVPE